MSVAVEVSRVQTDSPQRPDLAVIRVLLIIEERAAESPNGTAIFSLPGLAELADASPRQVRRAVDDLILARMIAIVGRWDVEATTYRPLFRREL